MAVIHWGKPNPHQRKISRYCLTSSSQSFECVKFGVKIQLPIHPQKVQHLDQYLMTLGNFDEMC